MLKFLGEEVALEDKDVDDEDDSGVVAALFMNARIPLTFHVTILKPGADVFAFFLDGDEVVDDVLFIYQFFKICFFLKILY